VSLCRAYFMGREKRGFLVTHSLNSWNSSLGIGSQSGLFFTASLGSVICRSQVRASLPEGLFFWYGPLASLSLQITSVASEHHRQNNGGPNQLIRIKITSWLLKIRLSLSCERLFESSVDDL